MQDKEVIKNREKSHKFCCKLAIKIPYSKKSHKCLKSFHSWVLKSKYLELSHLASSVQTNYPNTPHTLYRQQLKLKHNFCNISISPSSRILKAATQAQNKNSSFKVSLLDFKPFISSIISWFIFEDKYNNHSPWT